MFFVFYKSAFEHMWLKKSWYETLILAGYECYENIQENLHNSYSIVKKKKSQHLFHVFHILQTAFEHMWSKKLIHIPVGYEWLIYENICATHTVC